MNSLTDRQTDRLSVFRIVPYTIERRRERGRERGMCVVQSSEAAMKEEEVEGKHNARSPGALWVVTFAWILYSTSFLPLLSPLAPFSSLLPSPLPSPLPPPPLSPLLSSPPLPSLLLPSPRLLAVEMLTRLLKRRESGRGRLRGRITLVNHLYSFIMLFNGNIKQCPLVDLW